MSNIARVLRGPYGNRPATALEGCIYKPTDSPIESVMKGGAWRRSIAGMALVDPPDASVWTLIEPASALSSKVQLANYQGGTLLSYKAGGTGVVDLHVAKRAAPAIPYLIVTHLLLSATGTVFGIGPSTSLNFAFAGLVWRQSSNGAVDRVGIGSNGGVSQYVWRPSTASGTGTSVTWTDGSDYLTGGNANLDMAGDGVWLAHGDDGVNRYGYLSLDGNRWIELTAAARRPRTASATPDEVGIYVENAGTTGSTVSIEAFFTSYEVRSSGFLAAVESGLFLPDGRPSKVSPALPLQQPPATIHGVARAPRIVNGPIIR